MKKSRLKLFVLIFSIIFAISLFFTNSSILATDMSEYARGGVDEISETEGTPVVTSEEDTEQEEIEIHEGDLYVLYGEDNNYTTINYVMDKNVDGNVFIFGQNVKVTGQINGSLFVFASSLTIEEGAYIGSHVFAYANDITMAGFTYDMYAASQNFEMTNTGVVYRDLKVGADEAKLIGSIGRNVDIAASNINVFEDEEKNLYVGRKF